jgi:hypothetical protein
VTLQLTVTVVARGDGQFDVTPVGVAGADPADASPLLGGARPTAHAPRAVEAGASSSSSASASAAAACSRLGLTLAASRLGAHSAQEVQLSVPGLVVAVAEPPVAITPVREGIEK